MYHDIFPYGQIKQNNVIEKIISNITIILNAKELISITIFLTPGTAGAMRPCLLLIEALNQAKRQKLRFGISLQPVSHLTLVLVDGIPMRLFFNVFKNIGPLSMFFASVPNSIRRKGEPDKPTPYLEIELGGFIVTEPRAINAYCNREITISNSKCRIS